MSPPCSDGMRRWTGQFSSMIEIAAVLSSVFRGTREKILLSRQTVEYWDTSCNSDIYFATSPLMHRFAISPLIYRVRKQWEAGDAGHCRHCSAVSPGTALRLAATCAWSSPGSACIACLCWQLNCCHKFSSRESRTSVKLTMFQPQIWVGRVRQDGWAL